MMRFLRYLSTGNHLGVWFSEGVGTICEYGTISVPACITHSSVLQQGTVLLTIQLHPTLTEIVETKKTRSP